MIEAEEHQPVAFGIQCTGNGAIESFDHLDQEGHSMKLFSRKRLLSVGASSLFLLGVLNSVSANAALDENVTISFTALSNQITWQLTGIDVNTAGVSGTLGPFNNACAILQGHPKTTGNVMTRRVFVLDGGDASSAAALYVYERTDTISAASGQTNDAVTVTLTHTVPLALSGAANPICYMAGNDDLIIAGTSANVSAALIYKAGLAVETISQPLLSYGDTVSAVTASDNGFVFVTWGTGPNSGWAEYEKNANWISTGQNFNFTVLAGSTNAITF